MRARRLETPVEQAEAGRVDDGVRAGTALAAERGVRREAVAAMGARVLRRGPRCRLGEGEVGHRRNSRLVAAKRWPSASTTMSASQLPRAGRANVPAKRPPPRGSM